MDERDRQLIRVLTDELRALAQEIQAIHVDQQAAKNARDRQPVQPLRVEVTATPQLDPARREYYESENRERNSWWGQSQRWVETIGVGVAIALALFTLLNLREIRKQTPAVIKSGDASASAARTAHDSLIRSQRPWVGPDGVPAFDRPLIIDGDGTVHATFTVEINNFGPSPSLSTNMEAELYIQPTNGDRLEFERSTERSCSMADMDSSPVPPSKYRTGRYLFPNGFQRYQYNTSTHRGGATAPGPGTAIDIIGCIVYYDLFDEGAHHTRLFYMGNIPVGTASAQLSPCAVNQRID
jgi:hypothetical protein